MGLAASGVLWADTATPPAAPREDFGQYLVDHQDELAPFFSNNADDLVKLAIPGLMGLTGGLIFCTMLVGWVLDVLLSRGFSLYFAPAFTEVKRALVYATGRVVLSLVYTGLMALAIIFSLNLAHDGMVMAFVIVLLLGVALAAQIVWILYLYRTNFSVAAVFYLAVILVHAIACLLIAGPLIGSKASIMVTDFVDRAVTPKLKAEADAARHDLAAAESARDAVQAQVADLRNQIAQGQSDQEQLRQEIEAKKNSDLYVFSRIVAARARGELEAARDQFAAFPAKFPSSPLDAMAQSQLAQVNEQIALDQTQKKQEEVEAVQTAAQARADLLARAGKGEATLSEMRRALLGKTRAQVSVLLGLPSETASDSWGYRQQMIVNPMTNEKFGLLVYFTEGTVQGVDYDRDGGPQ